jgi:hypothetical protein
MHNSRGTQSIDQAQHATPVADTRFVMLNVRELRRADADPIARSCGLKSMLDSYY